MKQKPKIRILEDCLLVDQKILVIGDMHLGYNEYYSGKSLIPRTQLKEIIEKFERIFGLLNKESIKINKIILLGDLKHDFGEISDIEWRDSIKLLDYLKGKIREKNEIIVIKGNHDNILKPIVKKMGICLKDYYKLKVGNRIICFLHGNKVFKQVFKQCLNVQTFILGHLHPAITLSDKYKKEKFKCFLRGKWKKKQVYVLPSFGTYLGYDLSKLNSDEKKNKEFFIIKKDYLKNFEVIVYNPKEEKEYNFGKLKKLI